MGMVSFEQADLRRAIYAAKVTEKKRSTA